MIEKQPMSLTLWHYDKQMSSVFKEHPLHAAWVSGVAFNKRIISQGPCSPEESDWVLGRVMMYVNLQMQLELERTDYEELEVFMQTWDFEMW